jgi:cell division protein FtsW (lipid II flippase)
MLPRSVSRHDSRRSRRDPTAPLRHLDPVLLVCTVVLGLIGVMSVYSATRGPGPNFVDSYLVRQFAFVVVGTGVMVVFTIVDYHKLHDWAWLFYGATTALLLLVVSPLGSQSMGAQASSPSSR